MSPDARDRKRPRKPRATASPIRAPVTGPGRHHYRLFCLLDYEAKEREKPLLVVVDGRDKPFRTTISEADYVAVRELGREYRARNPRSLG